MSLRRLRGDGYFRRVEEPAGAASLGRDLLAWSNGVGVKGLPTHVTGVPDLALTIVKSSIRNEMSRSPAPLRARMATKPLRLTIGRSSVGGGWGGGVAVGAGVGAGVLTAWPAWVGVVGVAFSSQAANGSAQASIKARNVCRMVVLSM